MFITANGKSTTSERDAIEDAKINALEKAGVEVSVESVSTLSRTNGKAANSYNRKTICNSQALIKICESNVRREGGYYLAEIAAKVVFIPSAPLVHVFNLQNKYTLDKSLYFNLVFTDTAYLTIVWFDDNGKACGFLTKSKYVANTDTMTRFPDDELSYRNAISKMFDGREIVEHVNTNGETSYKRVYTEEFFYGKTWGTSTSKSHKVKNITLLFLTTPDFNSFNPPTPYFTKDDLVDWYSELPLEQRRRIVEKKITLEI